MRGTTKWRAWMGAVAVVGLTACGGEPEPVGADQKEGTAAPSLAMGKADGTGLIGWQGTLGWGEGAARGGEFTEDGKGGSFHAYELEVAAGAKLGLEVTQRGTSRGLDTTLYVFGPHDEAGGWGDAVVAYDDDDGWGELSRIRGLELIQGGTYLVVVGTYSGREAGRYRLVASCEDGQCEPAPGEPPVGCAFGSHYQHLFSAQSAMTVTSRRLVTSGTQLTALERDQLVAAVASTYTEARTVEQALGLVDRGQVNLVRLWDASSRRPFVAYEFGAGDNSYGMILEAGSTAPAARINDGDLMDCRVTWGEERRLCAAQADCAQGLQCQGVHDGQGVCLDLGATEAEALGSPCQSAADCGEAQGLVCAGESVRGGACVPAWMRRSFFEEPSVAIRDGGTLELPLDVYGLATVATDVLLDLWISHSAPQELRVTLTNPLGTEVVVFDGAQQRELYLDDEVLRGFSGDEDANGTWTLRVSDAAGGEAGHVMSFGLTVTSRWD